ncbi:MAG TPA: carbamoyl phosphate synthase, partial [Candidatus Ozemobacteraceae bacterium]|nr:carbamoyl phosphate synthase [Candidatus Ozemobacteraceae bacterium]
GGRGMRLVETEDRFRTLFNTAQAEAQSAFGDGRVYVEKYLRNPRHIEVQIMGDHHGNVVALGERECSIQRRHQKLIEESPSPAIDADLRKRLCETAVKAAKAIDYVNAGTIEFLLDGEKNFFFMEMNTRLQVEHPVTEFVTGYDLVEVQLRVASGEPLPFKQEDITPNGWAIECRINAEDPGNNFSPCPGQIENFLPAGGPWVRVDSAAYTGYAVSPSYDSMVAKLITWGPDREAAIDRMRAALYEFRVDGIKTTIPFHQWALSHPEFRSGNLTTGFVEKHQAGMLAFLQKMGKQAVPMRDETGAEAAAGNGKTQERSGTATA